MRTWPLFSCSELRAFIAGGPWLVVLAVVVIPRVAGLLFSF